MLADSDSVVGAYQVYVAGPMTNRPYFNFPAFDSVTEYLRRVLRWAVINPHEHDAEKYPGIDEAAATVIGDVQAIATEVGFSFAEAMTYDLGAVIGSHGIVMLPEWESSTGGRIERAVAEATGKDIWLAYRHRDNMRPWDGDWRVRLDPVQKRMAVTVIPVFEDRHAVC